MYPYLNLGPVHLGMFGLLLWLAAVVATVALHKNFARNGVDADALNVVALAMVLGIVGAKVWHELENVHELQIALQLIARPGWHHPIDAGLGFLQWFRDGFAWFGGLSAGIAVLLVNGHFARFKEIGRAHV